MEWHTLAMAKDASITSYLSGGHVWNPHFWRFSKTLNWKLWIVSLICTLTTLKAKVKTSFPGDYQTFFL